MYRTVSGFIKWVAVIIAVVAFIYGIWLGNAIPTVTVTISTSAYSRGAEITTASFNWSLAIGIWLGDFLISSLIYAFGAILDLLTKMTSQMHDIKQQLEQGDTSRHEDLVHIYNHISGNIAQLPPPIPKQTLPPPPKEEEVDPDDLMKCRNCGQMTDENKTHCTHCWAVLS